MEEANTNGLQLSTEENFRESYCKRNPDQSWWERKHTGRVSREPQLAKNKPGEARCCGDGNDLLLPREGDSEGLESAPDTLQDFATPPFLSVSPFLKLNVI